MKIANDKNIDPELVRKYSEECFNCEHDWEEVDSQFSNERSYDVECILCGIPGEWDLKNNIVYYPCT